MERMEHKPIARASVPRIIHDMPERIVKWSDIQSIVASLDTGCSARYPGGEGPNPAHTNYSLDDTDLFYHSELPTFDFALMWEVNPGSTIVTSSRIVSSLQTFGPWTPPPAIVSAIDDGREVYVIASPDDCFCLLSFRLLKSSYAGDEYVLEPAPVSECGCPTMPVPQVGDDLVDSTWIQNKTLHEFLRIDITRRNSWFERGLCREQDDEGVGVYTHSSGSGQAYTRKMTGYITWRIEGIDWRRVLDTAESFLDHCTCGMNAIGVKGTAWCGVPHICQTNWSYYPYSYFAGGAPRCPGDKGFFGDYLREFYREGCLGPGDIITVGNVGGVSYGYSLPWNESNTWCAEAECGDTGRKKVYLLTLYVLQNLASTMLEMGPLEPPECDSYYFQDPGPDCCYTCGNAAKWNHCIDQGFEGMGAVTFTTCAATGLLKVEDELIYPDDCCEATPSCDNGVLHPCTLAPSGTRGKCISALAGVQGLMAVLRNAQKKVCLAALRVEYKESWMTDFSTVGIIGISRCGTCDTSTIYSDLGQVWPCCIVASPIDECFPFAFALHLRGVEWRLSITCLHRGNDGHFYFGALA
jgi:hypothetical protein